MIYHYKKLPSQQTGGSGDGSQESPWYWYDKAQSNSAALVLTSPTIYTRAKLHGGTTYNIGQYDQYSMLDFDCRMALYTQSGTLIDQSFLVQYEYDPETDSYTRPSINGHSVSQMITYTPSVDTVVIIASGVQDYMMQSFQQGYKNMQFSVVMDIAPQTETIPQPATVYPTSQGFTDLGRAIGYRSAKLAGIMINLNPGLVFWAKLQQDRNDSISNLPRIKQLGTFTTYQNKPCIQFSDNNYVAWTGNSTIPSGQSAMSIFAMVAADSWKSDWMYQFGFSGGSNQSAFGLNQNKSRVILRVGSDKDTPYYMPTGQWVYLCLTRSASGDVKFYANGQLQFTTTTDNNVGNSVISAGANNGQSYEQSGPQYIRQCRIYDRELSAQEVAALNSL